MPKRSIKAPSDKPKKPCPDFPLFPHATKRWVKKIRGKFHYFGPWDDPDGALQKYLDQKDDLHAGRVPRTDRVALQLRDLLNHFLTAKQRKLKVGELKPKTFGDYHACGARLVDAFGAKRLVDDLRAEDFGRFRAQLAKIRGPVALGNEIQRVRTIFKYGYDAGLIDKPVRFGPEFVKPSHKAIRLARQAKGERMLEPDQINSLLGIASPPMAAMILLGVNCGLGNTDIGELPMNALDLNRRLVDFPRPKTAILRRSPLWPETVKALRKAIAVRPKPKHRGDAGLVFITKYGNRWVKTNSYGDAGEFVVEKRSRRGRTERFSVSVDSVGLEFGKLMQQLGLKCPGRFYLLRHVFRTIADEVRDLPAVDLIMGHENSGSMATVYRERISDDRLRPVTDHVHKWLFHQKPER